MTIRSVEPSSDATFEVLAAHLDDSSLPFSQRRNALLRLFEHHPLERLNAMLGVPWRMLAYDDALSATMIAGLRRDPGQVDFAIAIVRKISGELGSARSTVAAALVDALPTDGTRAHALALAELCEHGDAKLAARACGRFSASFESFVRLARVFDTPLKLSAFAGSRMLVEHLLARAASSLRTGLTDDDERAATRQIARWLIARTLSTAGRQLAGWPEAKQALTFIASHRQDDDPRGPSFHALLVTHTTLEVRQAALNDLVEAPLGPGLLAKVVRADPYEVLAATDPHDPHDPNEGVSTAANIAAVLVAAFPPDASLRLRYLARLTALGPAARAAVPLLLGLLAERSAPLVCAALGALKEIADASALPHVVPLKSGLFRDGRVKRLAREVAAVLAERGAAYGALSLAEVGGLALEDEE